MTTTPHAVDTQPVEDATRLTTQPLAPVQPARVTLLGPLRHAWRQLTSMRTALLLLFLLALASVPGGFLPQRQLNPLRVTTYIQQHSVVGPVLDRLSMFDVFTSVWFSAVYLLLFVSLIGCLLPRTRLHARALRATPPKVPATLTRLPVHERWETDADAEAVLEAARAALKGSRWRVVRRDGALSAEKGYLRETGNLLFHISLVLLLVGIAVGAFSGFKGTVLVKEGQGFSNTVLSYDDKKPGRRFDPASLVPLSVHLDAFSATYGPDGKALTFDARVHWNRPGGPSLPYDVRVNHPLHVDGAKVYLIGHGYAPHVLVKDATGQVALDQAVPCLPQDPKFLSNCVVKVPDAQPQQLGFKGVFTPTTVADSGGRVGSTSPALTRPALTLVAYRGDLGLDGGTPQSVYGLNTTSMTVLQRGRPALLQPGNVFKIPGGGTLTYVGTEEWATFQVTQDPGKGIALLASVGMVVGLLLSLFVRRRRLWVRVSGAGDGTRDGTRGGTTVEVGGLARTDAEAFAAEFAGITASLRTAAAPQREV